MFQPEGLCQLLTSTASRGTLVIGFKELRITEVQAPRKTDENKASEKSVGACVKFWKDTDRIEHIIQCTITDSNFSLCTKMPRNFIGKLQQENNGYVLA